MFSAVAIVGEGVNVALFCGLGFWLARRAWAAPTRAARQLASAAAAAFLVSTAVSLQRMGAVAVDAGWLPPSVTHVLWGPWEAVQVFASVAVLIWVARTLVHSWRPLARAERIVSVLTGRLPDEVDIEDADLSPRERQVLQLIGEGYLSDDALAGRLFIAPSTAATHVQRLLRKTGLHNRRELLLAANAHGSGPRDPTGDCPLALRLRRAAKELRGSRTDIDTGNGRPHRPVKNTPARRSRT